MAREVYENVDDTGVLRVEEVVTESGEREMHFVVQTISDAELRVVGGVRLRREFVEPLHEFLGRWLRGRAVVTTTTRTELTCDECGADLLARSYPQSYLALRSVPCRDREAGVRLAVLVEPEPDLHFCDRDCLRRYSGTGEQP